MKLAPRLAWTILLACIAAPATAADSPVRTDTLLREMGDLAILAEVSSEPFVCRQFSSYDRRAKSPEENWFANGDADKYLRVEERDGRNEYVMMDAEGPGAVVRIWSANPKGTLRIYLDGAQQPVLAVGMADLLGGKVPGVPVPIAGERSRGWNCFLPIPYAKRCIVTSDQRKFYYHVNYRTYAADVGVRTFEREDLERHAPLIEATAKVLAGCADRPRAEGETRSSTARLEPSQRFAMDGFEGPGAIVDLTARVEAEDVAEALRSLVLTIAFDGEQTVVCPLGDFFGAAPGINPYASLPMLVERDGTMTCRFVMPFRESARVIVTNRGPRPANLTLDVNTAARPWTDGSLLFHAKWRTEADVPTRPMVDWNYLTVEGRGTFVGAAFTIANPVKNWWGEGDEKIYVDGETFPSHFGTGTEDYYGYAWCCNRPFTHAYHAQPRCDGPGNYGHTSVNRWHVIDRIPFAESFRFDMELWHWHKTCRVTMAVVAYWYARPGAKDGFGKIEASSLTVPAIAPYVPPRVKGAIEGEAMHVIAKTARLEPQAIDVCSNESHMWWHDGVKIGDRMALGFQVEKAGRYRVIARFLKAADYGIARMLVNGAPAGDPIDLYNDGIAVSKEVDLGSFDLAAGENRIGAEITGANPKAIKAYFFGLDYLRLEPAR